MSFSTEYIFIWIGQSLEGQWLQIMQNPHGSYLFRDVVKILGGHLEMQEAVLLYIHLIQCIPIHS
jgi:hypothetical protein